MITNEMYDLHFQPIRQVFARISLLQNYFVTEDAKQVRKFKKVDEIQGVVSDGSININANSSARRSCSLDIVITNSSLLVSPSSKIFMDKWFKLEVGLKNLKTDKIVWFNQGIYAINRPSVKYDVISKSLHIEGLDLMCTLDDTLGGVLEYVTRIDVDTPISDAVKTTVNTFGKISKNDIYIEQNDFLTPYDIEKDSKDSVYSILEELRNLYMDWEFFFNTSGRFIYQKIRNRYFESDDSLNSLISFKFLSDTGIINNMSIDYDFNNVKNRIVVYGRTLDDGTQIKATKENNDTESPFNIAELGAIPYVFSDDKIFTQEQANQRAEYLYVNHNNFNEKINVQLLPLYFLDVNTLIEMDLPEVELSGKYLIDNITIPLSYDGMANFSAYKVYPIT